MSIVTRSPREVSLYFGVPTTVAVAATSYLSNYISDPRTWYKAAKALFSHYKSVRKSHGPKFANQSFARKLGSGFNPAYESAVTSAIESGTSFPGAPPPMPSEPKAGITGNERPYDAQYVGVYRNQRSTFGRKKRYTLKRVKSEMRQYDCHLSSRFQLFKDNGFQDGLGGRRLCFRPPVTSSNPPTGMFPFMIFDVTSMPCGVMHDDLDGQAVQEHAVFPIRSYQLGFNSTSSTNKEFSRYGWFPNFQFENTTGSNIKDAKGTFPNKNVAVIQDTTRFFSGMDLQGTTNQVRVPHCKGFTHSWSDIKLVMYPQTTLPTKWHVALISFPTDLVNGLSKHPPATAGPSCHHLQYNRVAEDYITYPMFSDHEAYMASRTAIQQNEDFDDLDYRWQSFWSGKLLNPINTDHAAASKPNAPDTRLPFKIIKHESFLQPARDNPDFGGQAQRLIKKLFYRRDWTFQPREVSAGPQKDQGDALYTYDTIQTASGNTNRHSNPFPQASEIVYLAIWCEHYKADAMDTADWATASGLKSPGTAEYPSFDLVCRMKHIIRPENMEEPASFRPDEPVAQGTLKVAEPQAEPALPDEPVKKKRSKKNGILNAPSEEGKEEPPP